MELFQVELTGFKRFKNTTSLKTRGKILAILGPNEAGKSSLLRAMHLLDVNDAYAEHERSRGEENMWPVVKATYLLSAEDRDAAGIDVGTWFDVTKRPEGERTWAIHPTPPDRDYTHRPKLIAQLAKLPKTATTFLAEVDDNLYARTAALFERIFTNEVELSAELRQQLSDLVESWKVAAASNAHSKIAEFRIALDAAFKIEAAKSRRIIAGEALWTRLPEYILFGAEDRDLKPSYAWNELVGGIPKALANLAKVAELNLAKLIDVAASNPLDPECDTIVEQANAALERNFQAAWKQSRVSVVLAHREHVLLIQVYNNDRSRTDFAQRSDGLRQFVALRCFTASREMENLILLIDEVEQHLHYDAQADLVQMLAGQSVASKVIYTTHSLGCLPEDLGNGVRLIVPTAPDSDWSRIENKFWLVKGEAEAAFSPILMGMGASTMAFFPTRTAVLVEGPSDSILLPSMFREAFERTSIGVQFVHGLSESGHVRLPLLNSTGTRVCYLVDNDGGGRTLANQLIERGVDRARVFHWPASRGDAELEDFVDAGLLAEAVSRLVYQHHGVKAFISAARLPKFGKWDFVVQSCHDAGIKPVDKVPVAYEVLELLDETPSRHLIDPRHKNAFRAFAERVMAKVQEQPA